MLTAALLAAAEHGLNRILRLDGVALAKLDGLAGGLIEIDCQSPACKLFLLPDGEGVRLAQHWEGDADVRLSASAANLARLALSRDKTSILHSPEVTIEGDSQLLMSFAAILENLELDWEHELSEWLGPVAAGLLGNALRSPAQWARQSADSLHQDVAEYLTEESRSLVGNTEADSRFSELDDLKLALDRLEARIDRLTTQPKAPTEK